MKQLIAVLLSGIIAGCAVSVSEKQETFTDALGRTSLFSFETPLCSDVTLSKRSGVSECVVRR